MSQERAEDAKEMIKRLIEALCKLLPYFRSIAKKTPPPIEHTIVCAA